MRREPINLTWNDYHDLSAEIARREFLEFILFTKPDFQVNWHHSFIANKIQDFVDGKIKNLMVFLPTQVGKSEMATRRLPAYILGKFPNKKIGVISASDTKAKGFNVNVQNIIDSEKYRAVFPKTRLGSGRDKCKRTENIFDIVDKEGKLESYGINGPANGSSFDVLILDDTIKNRQDACSIAIQKRNNNSWDSVLKLRLDNNSQILIVSTRWDEDDLAGYIQRTNEFDFEVIVFPALKVDDNNPDDPREIGDALWPEKHSRDRYEAQRLANPVVFEALQQQNPGVPTEILVYPKPWKQIDEMPDGYSVFYGMDFGFSISPDCLVEIMIKNNKAFIRELFYETGREISRQSEYMGTDALANKIKSVGAAKGPIYCDSNELRTIEDLQARGINALPAIKGPGSLGAGIQYVQSLDIHVTADSTNGWMEKKRYQYPTGADNKPIKGADPKDAFNHFMSAIRYGLYTYSIMGGITIYESKEDYY
jgi:hypothetical protein